VREAAVEVQEGVWEAAMEVQKGVVSLIEPTILETKITWLPIIYVSLCVGISGYKV
jgi:hypothetical protein